MLKFVITDVPVSKKGTYSSSRYLNENYKFNENKVIQVSEGIQFEPEENKRGGIITFSTDVNAKELDANKLINYIKQKVQTVKNRLFKDKKVNKIAQKYNLVGWTVGHYLSGRYTGKNGKVYDEKSLSVELIGIDSEELINIAEDLCIEFIQESVLVKDYNTGRIFFVDAE